MLSTLAQPARSRDLARRTDRDRRFVPHTRHHAAGRGEARRGRHHQPHARSPTTSRRIGPRTAPAAEGAHQQLRNFRVSRRASRRRTLAELGRAHGIPVAVDLGSGSLVDLSRWRLPHEPTVRETIAAGADLVAFSGDKLLGGPQAGILVGRADLIARLKKNPLKRALRLGQDDARSARGGAARSIDSPSSLAERLTSRCACSRARRRRCARRRRAWHPSCRRAVGGAYEVERVPMLSQIGSGALPVDTLPSHGLVARCVAGTTRQPESSRCGAACAAAAGDRPDRRRRRCGSTCAASRKRTRRTSPRSGAPCAHDRRHGRTHRPRQDDAGARPDRRGHRPAQGGEGARHLDRTRLRLHAARSVATCSASSTFPATSGWCTRWSPARPASTSRCWSSRPTTA